MFPQWADLGNTSDPQRQSWLGEMSLRERYRFYYDGLVFQSKVESENPQDAPLMFPLGLNLVKMLCHAQTDTAFGEWDDQIIRFEVPQDEVVDEPARQATQILSSLLRASNANSMLWEVELDRNIYGAGVWKVQVDLNRPPFVRWVRVSLFGFYPVFNPDDPNELLECYVVTDMTAEQARARYGIHKPSGEVVQRVEHWTLKEYTNTVDGMEIGAFSGVNPWGFIPFVYVPRLRSSTIYGDALTEDIIPTQDEMNMRLADLGEAINYNAHPVRWGFNLPRHFNLENFPIAPNALWDLGRVIGNSPPPQVGLLEAQNPIPSGTFEYLKFMYDWSRTSVFAPPIVFGEDNGGGQRSGQTLEIRMLPLIRATRRARAYMGEGLQRAIIMTGKILKQKGVLSGKARAVDRLAEGTLQPSFAEVLPRDHQAIVDEVVKLWSIKIPNISLETAQKVLGRGPGEVERILKMLDDEKLFPPAPEPMTPEQKGEEGKKQPQPEKKEAG